MDTINMETYEQFHASELCLNTLDKLKNYIKEQAKKTGNNRVGIFCATNLGLRSYVTRFVFNANDLNYYYHVQQTLGAGNPEFIGNVHTLSDPRLESLKIITDNDRTTTYIETAEERLFQVGDFDGAFIKDCARSFSFKVTEIRNNVAYNFRFYPTSHGMTRNSINVVIVILCLLPIKPRVIILIGRRMILNRSNSNKNKTTCLI